MAGGTAWLITTTLLIFSALLTAALLAVFFFRRRRFRNDIAHQDIAHQLSATQAELSALRANPPVTRETPGPSSSPR